LSAILSWKVGNASMAAVLTLCLQSSHGRSVMLPEKVSVTGSPCRVLFSDGYLYCRATLSTLSGRRDIVGLSLQNGSSLFAPLPDLVNGNMFDQLVSCGYRILLVGWLLEDERKILNEVHIWELLKVKVDSQIRVS